MKEEWRDIPGYEGQYQVSNLGDVKSIPRKFYDSTGRIQNIKGKMLSKTPDKDGYYRCGLSKKGKVSNYFVHKLVAICFLGDRPDNFQVNHIDGNKNNNKVSNLEYCTMRDNITHKNTKNGVKKFGIRELPSGRFQARIRYGKDCISIGSYDTKKEAYYAYYVKYIELHETPPW